MDGDLRFSVPGRVISENRALKVDTRYGHVRTYRTTECRLYQETVAAFARAARGRRPPLDGYLEVLLTLVAPHRSALPDADGIAKAPLDALQGLIYGNDRQIDHLDIWRRIVPGESHRLDVTVRRLAPGRISMEGGGR